MSSKSASSNRDNIDEVSPGGGEMAALIRAFDWSKTSLGPAEKWSQSLRTTINICLASDLPICVIWGPALVQIYNDAYRVICGSKHPQSLGQNFAECFREAWPVIGEAHDSARAGDTAFLENQHIFLERHGYNEETFFTFSFSPIREEKGSVEGLFHPVIETTANMLAERRTRMLRDLAARTANVKTLAEACTLAGETISGYDLDVPFSLLYLFDEDGRSAQLSSATGLRAGTVASPERVDLQSSVPSSWPLAEAMRTGQAQVVDDLEERFGRLDCGPYPEKPRLALVLPLSAQGSQRPTGFLVAGVSSRLDLSDRYRDFYGMLASAVATALANGRAYEEERERAEALAQIERAKTTFFSNVSHEFRTPLTLIMGTLEEAVLDPALPVKSRESLEIAQRNSLRLQKLVNNLLEFSRIEAGKAHAVFEPVDLAQLTEELASGFRSTFDRAGLTLDVSVPQSTCAVYVDRDMWEKIVLNLLSNAFKFTFTGGATVELAEADGFARLTVADTGTGVPAAQLPSLFQRFQRIEDARSRSFEGSGIGLALVQELVKLHGGSVEVASEEGIGTRFTVIIPTGTAHLSPEQTGRKRETSSTATRLNAFVSEARSWIPELDNSEAFSALPIMDVEAPAGWPDRLATRKSVLIADDNPDMRQYLTRLLKDYYEVETVTNGQEALASIERRRPDLLVSDVMMPVVGGLALLQAIRANPETASLPVILLSARAGEELEIEGLQAGADDYLTKPFSARELSARVSSVLKIADVRTTAEHALRASEERFRCVFEQTTGGLALCDASGRFVMINDRYCEITGRSRQDLLGLRMQDITHPDDLPGNAAQIAQLVQGLVPNFVLEKRYVRPDGSSTWVQNHVSSVRGEDGKIQNIVAVVTDLNARKQAEEAMRQSAILSRIQAEQLEAALTASATGTFRWDPHTGEFFEFDNNLKRLFGRGPDAQIKTTEDFISMVHPEDVPALAAAVEACRDGADLSMEYRVVWCDGSIHWLYDRGKMVWGDGKPAYLVGACTDITERKQAEQELQRFAATVENSYDFIGISDLEDHPLYGNPRGMKMVGIDSLEEFRSHAIMDFFIPQQRRFVKEVVLPTVAGGGRWVGELTFQHFKTRAPIPVLYDIFPVHDSRTGKPLYFATVTRDMSEQKRAEEELGAQRERFNFATAAAHIGYWFWNLAFDQLNWDNQVKEHHWLAPQTGVTIGSFYECLHPDDRERTRRAIDNSIANNSPYDIEYRTVGKDGNQKWIHAIGRTGCDSKGDPIHFDGITQDVTTQKRSEEALRKSEKLAVVGRMAASISHEINNPLESVTNLLFLLRDHAEEDTRRDYLRLAEEELARVSHIVTHTLQFNRSTRQSSDVRISTLLESAVGIYQARLTQSGVEVIRDYRDSYFMQAQDSELRQVFSNLIGNAFDASNPGGKIVVRARDTVDWRTGRRGLRVTIADTGHGMDRNTLLHLCEAFFTTKGMNGTGLGRVIKSTR